MKPRLTAGLLVLLAAAGAAAEEAPPSRAHAYFTDTVLINQDGQPMRLYSDLIRGRTVVINTFFTTCTGICPPLNGRMADIQRWLGERLGPEAYLISISVDPATDTPERLKEYAGRFKAKPGWFFLTGPKANVDLVLSKLGQFVQAPEDHSAIMLVGNDRTELWKKAMGLAPREAVIEVVESVVDDR